MVSLCHGAVAILYSGNQLLRNPYQLDMQNNQAQETIMAYSTAYFLTDFVFLILFLPEEFAYLVHHVVTLIYLASNVYLGFGGISCMALMFTGELTESRQSEITIRDMDETGLATYLMFLQFAFRKEESSICLKGKSMTLHRGE